MKMKDLFKSSTTVVDLRKSSTLNPKIASKYAKTYLDYSDESNKKNKKKVQNDKKDLLTENRALKLKEEEQKNQPAVRLTPNAAKIVKDDKSNQRYNVKYGDDAHRKRTTIISKPRTSIKKIIRLTAESLPETSSDKSRYKNKATTNEKYEFAPRRRKSRKSTYISVSPNRDVSHSTDRNTDTVSTTKSDTTKSFSTKSDFDTDADIEAEEQPSTSKIKKFLIKEDQRKMDSNRKSRQCCHKCKHESTELEQEEELEPPQIYPSDNKIEEPPKHFKVRRNVRLLQLNITPHNDIDINLPDKFTLYIHSISVAKDLNFFYTGNSIDSTDDLYNTFVLKWNFLSWHDEISFEPSSSLVSDERILNFHKNYPFKMSAGYYLYLSRCPMPIELYVCSDTMTEKFIGRANLKFDVALNSANKVFSKKLDITNYELCLCFKGLERKLLGTMVCKFVLNGNQAIFDGIKPRNKALEPVEPMAFDSSNSLSNLDISFSRPSAKVSVVDDSEAYQDGFNMGVIRNNALYSKPGEMAKELKERVTWMHEELKWRLTLQQNAILCGTDPNKVNWRQWKDEASAHVKVRALTINDFKEIKQTIFTIRILNLKLHKYVMNDERITNMFVEYSFLGKTGKDLESPCLKKRTEIPFYHERSFIIKATGKNAQIVSDMIKHKTCITFTIVSQPDELLEEVQTCKEVGRCNVELFQLIQSRSNFTSNYYPVVDEHKSNLEFGKLTVAFNGVLGLRSIALKNLTPDKFKLIP